MQIECSPTRFVPARETENCIYYAHYDVSTGPRTTFIAVRCLCVNGSGIIEYAKLIIISLIVRTRWWVFC